MTKRLLMMYQTMITCERLLLMFWRNISSLFILQKAIIKEFFKMTFTKKSTIAQSYVVLILAGEITINNVPNVGNLREVVQEILTGEQSA